MDEQQQQAYFQTRIGRRALIIGGGAAALAVAGGTFIFGSNWSTPQLAGPPIKPVHFTAGHVLLRLQGHKDSVTNIVWSPDGRYLASASNDPFALLWDIPALLRQAVSGSQTITQPTFKMKIFPYGLSTDQLHWTPDGRYLLTTLSEIPTLLNPFKATDKPGTFSDTTIKKDAAFGSPIACPQGTILAAIDGMRHRYYQVDLWQFHVPGKPYAHLTYRDADQFIGDSPLLNTIAWSSDGIHLAGITNNDEIIIWNVQDLRVSAVLTLPPRKTPGMKVDVIRVALYWSPADPELLAVNNVDTITIINTVQKRVVHQLITNDAGALNSASDPQQPGVTFPNVIGLAWSPDGRYIAGSYARSSKIFIWDLQAKNASIEHGLMLQTAFLPPDPDVSTGAAETLNDLSWSPDGHYLATASSNHTITIWLVDSAA